jgi:hypothetical protein
LIDIEEFDASAEAKLAFAGSCGWRDFLIMEFASTAPAHKMMMLKRINFVLADIPFFSLHEHFGPQGWGG